MESELLLPSLRVITFELVNNVMWYLKHKINFLRVKEIIDRHQPQRLDTLMNMMIKMKNNLKMKMIEIMNSE